MFNFGENAHNSNCTAVVGQTSLFLCSNFNYVCNLYLKYDKKNLKFTLPPQQNEFVLDGLRNLIGGNLQDVKRVPKAFKVEWDGIVPI